MPKLAKKKTWKSSIHKSWLALDGGPTLLEIAMLSPIGLMSALIIDGDFLSDEMKEQAEMILDTLRFVRPPNDKNGKNEFIIRLGNEGTFVSFRIVRKGSSSPGPGEHRQSVLNLAPREWLVGGDKNMMRLFHKHYFGQKPTPQEMVTFITNESNFNYGGIGT